MLQINTPLDPIIKMLGEQSITNCEYRPLTYTQTCEVEDGLLVYNLMTKEFVFLSKDEISAFKSIDTENETVKALIKKWFFVPENNDDSTLFEQVDFMWRTIADNDDNPPINRFIIFPTTDCNARCFYCFELDCKRITMTELTAHDVADFIRRKSDGNCVRLQWFGGEPLYNAKAIDIICDDLREFGIDYVSGMTSNGYLFDENTVKKAKEKWKLDEIQITLDGTEEVYNRCKNYIYKDVPSPFVKVMKNIELLLKAEIYVNIRLNMDTHNCDNLKILTEQLMEQFGQLKYFNVYIALLFENTGKRYIKRSFENKKKLYDRYGQLSEIIGKYGRFATLNIESYRTANMCMADDRKTTMILPDGKLGRCECYTDDNYYGSIYSEEVDKIIIDKFMKRVDNRTEKCSLCPMRPKCIALKACPHTVMECDDYERKKIVEGICKSMIASYKYYLENKNNEENSDETKVQFCS